MATPNWGLLTKSVVDDETIEEAIQRIVQEHDDDETAHLDTGQALQSHKASEIIDHAAASIIDDKLALRTAKFDKLAFDRSSLFFNWASVDGWGSNVVGSGVVDNGIGRLLLDTGATVASSAELIASDAESAVPTDYDSSPRSVFSLKVDRRVEGTLKVGPYSEEENGLGFTFTPSVVAEQQPAGASNQNWYCVACSHTGQYRLGCIYGGRLWLSDDYGATWSEVRPAGDADKSWRRVAISSTGQYMLCCAEYGRVYRSDDYGATWVEVQPAGDNNKNWYALAMAGASGYALVGATGGRLYVSTDYGATWAETRPAGDNNKNWQAVAIREAGNNMVAVVYGGRVYSSQNYGAAWNEERPAGDFDKNWTCVVCIGASYVIYVGVSGGRLYKGDCLTDVWSEVRPAGDADKGWNGLAYAGDINLVFACVENGRLYYSADDGTTWTELTWGGATNKSWQFICASHDASYLIGCAYAGRIYSRAFAGSILSAYVCNLTTNFSLAIDAAYYLNAYARYEIVMTSGVKVEYYINSVLVATIYDADIEDGLPTGEGLILFDFLAANPTAGRVYAYCQDLTVFPSTV